MWYRKKNKDIYLSDFFMQESCKQLFDETGRNDIFLFASFHILHCKLFEVRYFISFVFVALIPSEISVYNLCALNV